MTPSSRRPVLSSAFHMPDSVEVVEGTLLAWSSASDDDGLTFRGGDDLLPAFLKLASAVPDEMAEFMAVYGVPELCQHGRPDRHWVPRDVRRFREAQLVEERHCPPTVIEDGRPVIASEDIRRVARAFVAARSAAKELTARKLPIAETWAEMTPRGWSAAQAVVTDWQTGRIEFASWVSELLRECGVAVLANWSDSRLRVTYEADGLLGTLALLLAREVGQGGAYGCDVCGAVVERVRPPKQDEGVYCDKPACRRAQQRKNQASWRAKKRAEGRIV